MGDGKASCAISERCDPRFVGSCARLACGRGDGRIERLCADVDEERPLRIALVDALRRLAPFGPYVWAVTDPVTEVAIAPLADVPPRRWPRCRG